MTIEELTPQFSDEVQRELDAAFHEEMQELYADECYATVEALAPDLIKAQKIVYTFNAIWEPSPYGEAKIIKVVEDTNA